jgi:hypothetical protein
MLEKIDAPPPQMVVCDYCAKMVDKRELKHHQVAVATQSPVQQRTPTLRARVDKRQAGGENARQRAGDREGGSHLHHLNTPARTHAHNRPSTACSQS